MKKSAFTLAEVLITLGIIGIIAAMTFPTLIAGYQKKVWVAQLQKSVNILENGFLMMKADAGVDKLSETGMWGEENKNSLKKYFKFITVPRAGMPRYEMNMFFNKVSENVFADSWNFTAYYILADGMLLYFDYGVTATIPFEVCKRFKSLGGNMCSKVATVTIDVNGLKKPNQMGRDVFAFFISDEGHLYPLGGRDSAIYSQPTVSLDSNVYYWRNSSILCGVPDEPMGTDIIIAGDGCAARIIENGWKMDY